MNIAPTKLLILLLLFWEIFKPALADGFPLKFVWQQVSRTLLSILTDLNNAVVLMVSTCPYISKSSRLFTNPLEIVLSVPITISITVTFMFSSFLRSSARSTCLSLFLLSFSFILCTARMEKSMIRQILFFFVDYH